MKDEIKEKFKEKHKKEIEEINNQFEELIKDDEIKEILNGFKEILDNPTTTDECCDGRIIEIDRSYDLDLDEIKILLNYITTLQEENERLKNLEYKFFDNSGDEESFTLEDYLQLGNEVYDLQEENEKLKEIIENLTTMTVCGDKKQIKNTAQYKLEDYKSRIDKAKEIYDETIDYLTTINTEFMDRNTKMTIKEMIKNLEKELDILQGSDKE